MSKRSVTTGRDPRTIALLAEEQGGLLERIGSFIGIRNEKGQVEYVKNSNRTLTKPERERIYKRLFAIGFFILIGAACWLWYIPQLQMAGM